MGTITASSIINTVARLLYDVDNIMWSRTELLDYINDGQRLVVMLQPNATNTIQTVQLSSGTRQSLPTDGWLLLDILRNMGTDGTTPGRAIRVVSRKLLDTFDPDWHNATQSVTVQNYVFDLQDQTAFFVYPPSPGTNYVEINYSAIPSDLASEADPITLSNAYEDILVNFVMFKAYAKNSDFGDPGKAAAHLAIFNQLMGSKVEAEEANTPNISLTGAPPVTLGGSS